MLSYADGLSFEVFDGRESDLIEIKKVFDVITKCDFAGVVCRLQC